VAGDSLKGREATADRAARWAAAVVLIVGLTVVVFPALLHPGELWSNPFDPSQTTLREITTLPYGTQIQKVTTSEADRSFIERALSSGGLLLARIGAVALAAFLAGAVVQRTVLANFALKMGPLELPETKRTAAASEEALEAVQGDLALQAQATKDSMRVAADAAAGVAALAEDNERLREALGALVALVQGVGPTDEPPLTHDDEVADEGDVHVEWEPEDTEGNE
jgi:hypothetical protein